jgi:hypothetical protein
MSELVAKLNEILADELACVCALQRADPSHESIQRICRDCEANRVSLGNIIRDLGGQSTEVPSPRFSLKLSPESLDEALDMAQSVQRHILDEVATLIDDPGLKSARSQLAQIQQRHRDALGLLNAPL